MKETLDQVRQLYTDERFDDALRLIENKSKTNDLPPNLLILKGRLIQLSEKGNYELLDAERCFLDVLEQDHENVTALLELGWLHVNVLNNSSQGMIYFDRALTITKKLAKEAMDGKSKCAKRA